MKQICGLRLTIIILLLLIIIMISTESEWMKTYIDQREFYTVHLMSQILVISIIRLIKN